MRIENRSAIRPRPSRRAGRATRRPRLWGCGLFASIFLASASATHAAEPVKLTADGLLKQRPAWLPDNQHLVFARHEDDTIRLYTLDTRSGTEQRLTDRDVPEYDAVPLPDGQSFLLAFDKVSPNQGDIDIARWTPEAKTFEPLIVTGDKLSHEEWPALSADGNRIAYTSTRDGNQELYVTDANGQNSVRLTQDPAHDAHPCWSPDGKSIAFATNRWGDLEIALISPDGSDLRRVTDSVGLDDYPAYSPDGARLAFTTNVRGSLDIALADVTTGETSMITEDEALDNFPCWAPDGRLTFVSDRDGGFEVYVLTPP
jgi:TolB protein